MKERILILSADAHLRQWLVNILRSNRVQLETAAHGAAGLALLAEKLGSEQAALAELTEERGDIVTVRDGEKQVRVWIDESKS